jgi:drug/metabolite transporter (DMT)-like permease
MIIAAVASYGIAINIARPLQQNYGALPVIWRGQLIAVALTAPMGIPAVIHGQWTVWPIVSLILLGAGGTGIAFVLTSIVAGRMGAPIASAIAFLIPPVALLIGVVARHEHVAVISAIGCAVCVAGAVIMQRQPKSPSSPHEQLELQSPPVQRAVPA